MNKQEIIKLFQNNDIRINGINSWDIQVHNDLFYENYLYNQTLGLAKSYINNIWSSNNLAVMLNKYININFIDYFGDGFILSNLNYVIFNVKKLIYNHFRYIETPFLINFNSINNELYNIVLDPYMCYTSGHWNIDTLDLSEAQINGMEIICRNLEIRPNMKCLVISGRYPSLANYLARIYLMESYAYTMNMHLDNINHSKVQVISFNEIDLYAPYDRIIWVSDLDSEPGFCEYVYSLNKLLKKDGKLLYKYWDFKSNYNEEFLAYVRSILGNKNINHFHYKTYNYNNSDNINYSKTISVWISKMDHNYEQLQQVYNHKFLKLYYFYLNYINALLISNKITFTSVIFKSV